MKPILFFILSAGLLIRCNNPQKNDSAVNEQFFMDLGGEKQYVEITGTSANNPVLLFIHGGPGWPQTPYLRYFNPDLPKAFVLVSWDQAGCGKSYMNDPDPKNLSLDELIRDAHQLTLFLKRKYNKDKIFLAGFSWGSIIGLRLAKEYPEDYLAYFGISQLINSKEGSKISREWIRKKARENNDTSTTRILDGLDKGDTTICNNPIDCMVKQYGLLTKYHGAIYHPSTDSAIEKMMTRYDDYKKYNWDSGFYYSAYRMQDDLFNTDLSSITEIKIPVYFFLGRQDWNIPTSISVSYLDKLKCPQKGIVWFENSGHEPLEEEASLFDQKLIEKAGL